MTAKSPPFLDVLLVTLRFGWLQVIDSLAHPRFQPTGLSLLALDAIELLIKKKGASGEDLRGKIRTHPVL